MADTEMRERATPQEIWEILRQVSESQKETGRRMQETDRLIREVALAVRVVADVRGGRTEPVGRRGGAAGAADPALAIPGYAVEREFGRIRILRRQSGEPAVRLWQDYTPTITGVERTMSRVDPDAPVPPPDSGVRVLTKRRPVPQSPSGSMSVEAPAPAGRYPSYRNPPCCTTRTTSACSPPGS